MTPIDFNIVAQTCWGEARGEGHQGMQAVAEVILNRAADGRWPDNPADVCKQPKQFSTWNKDDPNLPKLAFLTLDGSDGDTFRDAYRAVLDAMAGGKITFGANHYFAPGSISMPKWAKDMELVTEIGRHRFYRG